MGSIANKEDEDLGVEMTSQFLIGSSTLCSLRVIGDRVSPHHAEVLWTDQAWAIRDLGSSHGTFVNERRIGSAAPVALRCGDLVGLGTSRPLFRLVDDSPPKVFARNLNTGEALGLSNDELMLTAPGEAPVRIIRDGDSGDWLICRGGRLSTVASGDVVGVGSQVYSLHLLDGAQGVQSAASIESVDLTLRVSSDEEFVEVWLREPNENISVMPPRAHYYTMLLLARMRLEDRAQKKLEGPDEGWRSVPELCRMLSVGESRLNVDIYRIRRDIAKIGLVNSKGIIERRRSRRLVRLGVENVSICEM